MSKKVVIAGDHAGFDLKKKLIPYLQNKGFEVEDLGPFSAESVDYPDFAHVLAKKIESGNAQSGVLICGSGNGVSMAANKHQNIRAALCWKPEIAMLAKQHNNANVVALPARFISEKVAKEIIDAFFDATFEGGRHMKRVNKIACC